MAKEGKGRRCSNVVFAGENVVFAGEKFKGRLCWGKFKCRLCLRFFTGRGGRRFFSRTEDFFYRGRGGNVFFLDLNFFLQEGGGRRGRTRKKRPDVKGVFFPLSPRASLFPQRHRDGVSRLTEGTPGGLGREKKPLWRLVFFSGGGVEWGQGEKRGKIENSKTT